ncbi:agmatinase [Sulfurospirillum sp.]|nr:agmatinase [Sulfurospirillum sp.]
MNNKKISILGIPFDENSSYKKGPSLAPKLIEEALHSDSSNMWTECGINLKTNNNWVFEKNIDFNKNIDFFAHIETSIENLLNQNKNVISLGGDHSITYPIINAYSKKYNNLTILHFDAHPDLYDELDGNKFSHASPFARIMEKHLVNNLIQVGIRTLTGHQKEQAEKFNVKIIDMKNISKFGELKIKGDIYISFDMDCLDPAFAPGVSHFEPGGMSTREVLSIIQNLNVNLVGADIVEYNPKRDINGMTSMVAAKILKEILAKMIN